MNRPSTTMTALSLFLASALAGPALSAEDARPAGVEAEAIKIEATVTAVNLKAREVTVKDAEGNEVVLRVGEEARNLPQVEVGDQVTAEYFQGMAFHVEPAGTGKPLRVEKTVSDRAPSGHKPSGEVTTYVEIIARVEALDPAKRTVTLRGPNAVVTLRVQDDIDLSNVKVDDMVKANFVESYAISVEAK
jgi:hypothetical protein